MFTFSFRVRIYDDSGGPGDYTPAGILEVVDRDEHLARRSLLFMLHSRGLWAEFVKLEKVVGHKSQDTFPYTFNPEE